MASLIALLRPPALLLPCSPPHGSGLAPVRRAHSYSSPPPTGLAPALLLPQLTIETTCVADGLAGLAILTVTELEARPQESPASPASPPLESKQLNFKRTPRDATSPVVARAREAAAQRMLPRTRPARAASQKLQRRARIAARSGRAVRGLELRSRVRSSVGVGLWKARLDWRSMSLCRGLGLRSRVSVVGGVFVSFSHSETRLVLGGHYSSLFFDRIHTDSVAS